MPIAATFENVKNARERFFKKKTTKLVLIPRGERGIVWGIHKKWI